MIDFDSQMGIFLINEESRRHQGIFDTDEIQEVSTN